MAVEVRSMMYDYIVFVVFVIASTFVAIYTKFLGPKERTKSDYVFGSAGSVSMVAMMLSIARGTLGVRSLLGYPPELIYRGSAMWETLYGVVLSFPVVCFVFVPVYYNLGITSVYEYLDMRFKSRLVRCLASATYIARMVLNLGVTVFTPCIALNITIGLPYWASISGITIITVFFTIMGGLKTAILADVFQGTIMILVSLVIIGQGLTKTKNFTDVYTISRDNGRLNFFNFDTDASLRVTTISALLGQLFISLSQYGCQQNLVQRYCSMKSEMQVRKTLLWNMPLITVLFSIFWIMGMVIYAVYVDCDPLKAGYITKIDEVVPFFVENEFMHIPGFLGLCMATLFNGALSLYVSQLSSVATVTWEDFINHIPMFRNYKDHQQLTMIKIIGAIYGVFIMGITFAVSLMSGVIDSSMLVTSATSGPLLGVFLLAMLIPCANWKGASAGIIISHVLTLWVAFGGLTIEKPPIKQLPTSIEGCRNDTFSSYMNGGSHSFWTSAPIPINGSDIVVLENVVDTSQSFLSQLYSISYMYYCMFGCLSTIFIGTIVSYILPSTKDDLYGAHLLHPIALKISRIMPGKKREYLAEPWMQRSSIGVTPKEVVEQKTISTLELTRSTYSVNGSFNFKSDYM